jgi:hypothetical protein
MMKTHHPDGLPEASQAPDAMAPTPAAAPDGRTPDSTVPAEPQALSFLLTVVDRGQGERVTALLRQHGAAVGLILKGHGTATSEILNLLGLGETSKDVVFSTLPSSQAHEALAELREALELDRAGRGIAMSLSIASVGGPSTLQILSGKGGANAHDTAL